MSQALPGGESSAAATDEAAAWPAPSEPRAGSTRDAAAHGRALSRLRAWLAHRRAPALIVLVSLSLTAFAIGNGFTQDDYLHWLMLHEQYGSAHEPWWRALDLFRFADADPVRARNLMLDGVYPWWSDPGVRLSFFRPLASLTHSLDHALWPSHPELMHVHSLLWFALVLVSVTKLYRRFCPSPWVAGLALLLYAIDDARAFPVGWLANRNALIATVPSVLALLAHDRWRRLGSKRDALLSPALLALGLCAGETTAALYGYFIAYAFTLDPGSRRQGLCALAPTLLLLLAWRLGWTALGYGTAGTGLYVDPGTRPLAFAQLLAINLPLSVLSLFALPWAESWDLAQLLAPTLRAPLLITAYLACACVVWLGRPLLARDASLRFWALGALLALLPACAVASPNDRLLTAAGIGSAALIAQFLASVAERAELVRRPAARLAALLLVAVHVLLSPLFLAAKVKAVGALDQRMNAADRSIPRSAALAARELVLINVPLDPFGSMFSASRLVRGLPTPQRFRWLATAVSELHVARIDARTLELRPEAGFLSTSSQWVWRDPSRPARVGESVELDGATFVVTALTTDGRPAAVRVRFAEPLESPRYLFMRWRGAGYVPFPVPAPGQALTLPAADMHQLLLGAPPQPDQP